MSASTMPHQGPARMRDRSRTRTPASGSDEFSRGMAKTLEKRESPARRARRDATAAGSASGRVLCLVVLMALMTQRDKVGLALAQERADAFGRLGVALRLDHE